MNGYGIDVSHHNASASIPWSAVALRSSFCICRATYGTKRDTLVESHVRSARTAGLAVGLYHFFRISQPVDKQIAAFHEVAALADYQVGDIVPALDIEHDPVPHPGADVSPSWQGPIKQMLDALVAHFGDAIVYVTQREFGQLGKPAWILDRPLWVAHYTGAAKPATPAGRPPLIWQHRVGPYESDGVGGYDKKRPLLDQNRSYGPLPRATRVPWEDAASVLPGVHGNADEDEGESWASLRARVHALQADYARELVEHVVEDGFEDELPTKPIV